MGGTKEGSLVGIFKLSNGDDIMKIIDQLNERTDLLSLGGAEATQIDSAENKLGLRFSNEYREYVSEFGAVSFADHELTGISKSPALDVVTITIKMREFADVPSDWYVIEQTHIDDIVFWQATGGQIYKTAPHSSHHKVCDSLADYIRMNK